MIGYEGKVKFRTVADVDLTADDWQLFTASMDCSDAAAALNKAATMALSCGDPEEALELFRMVQDLWADFGARDSEPSAVFGELFRRVYDQV